MDHPLIKKKILSAGTKPVTFTKNTKVQFHYCTKKCDEVGTILDDSKKSNRPMELIIGKKFRLEAWEVAVQTMALNEVASFTVDQSLLQSYPFVAKTLRDASDPKKKGELRRHCCASSIHNNCIELVKVESPEEYEKESWQMEDWEKLKMIPELKTEGNQLYNKKEYDKACEKYATALGMLDELMIREKPKEKQWLKLNDVKLPILLNFAQCKLLQKDYYPVIQHCTTVLQSQRDNVKALFRRGKAHIAVWNWREAEKDMKRVAELDPTLTNLVRKELKELEQMKKQKDEDDKKKLLGKIFQF